MSFMEMFEIYFPEPCGTSLRSGPVYRQISHSIRVMRVSSLEKCN